MKLRPLNDHLLVKPIEEDETTRGGIFLPETAKEKPQQGEVLSVGPGARNGTEERIPLDVSVGDRVLYAKYSGTDIKIEGKAHLILRERDVLAIVNP